MAQLKNLGYFVKSYMDNLEEENFYIVAKFGNLYEALSKFLAILTLK